MSHTPPGRTREKVWNFVRDRLLAGAPPTVREVRDAFGFRAIESARSHLEALVEAGLLEKDEDDRGRARARGYRLPRSVFPSGAPAPTLVPVLGRVQAGALTSAVEEMEGAVSVQSRCPPGEMFALRVRGDSMRDAGILDGDLVIVRRQPLAADGQIVVALVGDEATVKRLRIVPGARARPASGDDPEAAEGGDATRAPGPPPSGSSRLAEPPTRAKPATEERAASGEQGCFAGESSRGSQITRDRNAAPADPATESRAVGPGQRGLAAGALRGGTASSSRPGSALVGDISGERPPSEPPRRAPRIELHPENSDFEVIVPPPGEVRILGRVVEVRRHLDDSSPPWEGHGPGPVRDPFRPVPTERPEPPAAGPARPAMQLRGIREPREDSPARRPRPLDAARPPAAGFARVAGNVPDPRSGQGQG